jgi:hypothetical protein
MLYDNQADDVRVFSALQISSSQQEGSFAMLPTNHRPHD